MSSRDYQVISSLSQLYPSIHPVVSRIKKSMENYLETRKLPYSKYINWPSCDSEDWMWRYWGNNYNTLLHIKVSHPPTMGSPWDDPHHHVSP